MPAKPVGVYRDSRDGWYFKVSLGRDPLTGRRTQVTRGFRTATEAARARRDLIGRVDIGVVRSPSTVLTVNELLDLYLDGLDADERLSAKTRFDYRHYAQDYVRPLLGGKKVRDLTPDSVVAWQRALTKGGGVGLVGEASPFAAVWATVASAVWAVVIRGARIPAPIQQASAHPTTKPHLDNCAGLVGAGPGWTYDKLFANLESHVEATSSVSPLFAASLGHGPEREVDSGQASCSARGDRRERPQIDC